MRSLELRFLRLTQLRQPSCKQLQSLAADQKKCVRGFPDIFLGPRPSLSMSVSHRTRLS